MPPPTSPRERFTKPGRIDARPKNPRYMSGLSAYYALQNRDVPAFEDRRRPGMNAREIAESAVSKGYRLGANGLEPDTNRPRPAPTREGNIAAAKANGSFEEIRRRYNRENPGKRMNKRGDILDVEKDAPMAGKVEAPKGVATAKAGAGPLPDDRPSVASAEARKRFFGTAKPAATAKAGAGPLPDDRPSVASAEARKRFFGTPKPAATALATDAVKAALSAPASVPTRAPETPAMRRRMLRDAEMGRSETRNAEGKITGIQSKYGTGSVKFFKPGEARPVAMTKDEFGKPETMASYLARRKAVQASKGMV